MTVAAQRMKAGDSISPNSASTSLADPTNPRLSLNEWGTKAGQPSSNASSVGRRASSHRQSVLTAKACAHNSSLVRRGGGSGGGDSLGPSASSNSLTFTTIPTCQTFRQATSHPGAWCSGTAATWLAVCCPAPTGRTGGRSLGLQRGTTQGLRPIVAVGGLSTYPRITLFVPVVPLRWGMGTVWRAMSKSPDAV